MRSLLPWFLILALWPASLAARDVYGNATPWTSNDSIIWDLHQKQNKFVAPSSGKPDWASQIAARNAEKREAAASALRDSIESRERNARIAEREANYRPLTWAQEMAGYIVWNGDRAAPEQETLAFYFVQAGDLPNARRHLEMVLFRKGPRAGEAAWQLYLLHKADGPEPDAKRAAGYLDNALALGYSADELLAQILPRGPEQRLPAAMSLLAALVASHPENASYAQRYAELLAGDYGGEPNLPAALPVYQRIAAAPDASPAVLTLTARLLATDLPGRPADHGAAFPLWERAAKQWERYAQYRYAEALFKGIGCPADPAAALQYIDDTTRDDRPAPAAYPLYTLGAQLLRGNPSIDRQKWGRVATRMWVPDQFAPAQLEIAHALYAASKVQRADRYNASDPQQAFFLADRAARAGLDEARLLLARFYWEGFGTPVDLEAAHEIFTSGVAAGVPMAMAALAEIQLEPGNRFQDTAAGFALAVRAAAAGNARGHFLVGRCYLRGEGTGIDVARAKESLERSAQAGDVDALTLLADLRLVGRKADPAAYAQSLAELQQAAEGGSIEAAVGLIKALGADPSRPPERLKKLNQALTAVTGEEDKDEAFAKDWDAVSRAANQLELLTGQRRDPALSYATALWLLGEPTSFAPPTGLTYYSVDLFSAAAHEGNPGAQYHEALREIAIGRNFLADPEEDVTPFKEGWESKYSAGHLATGLDHLRAAAASGHPGAITYLKARGIEVVSPVADGAIDQAAIEKIDPAVRGGRAEGEYVLARRALRIAREHLAKPQEDTPMLSDGRKYSDAYFEEALKYFRSSAAAGVPEAISYLSARNIPMESTDAADQAARALMAAPGKN